MFVKRIPFVVSFLRGFNFATVEYVSQRLNSLLANYIGKIFHFYKNNIYTIKTFLEDREFECIYYTEEVNINTTATN